ncbi:MAG: tRNA 2-thiouridine(34) synthase MnmA [Alkalispirochaeta sp.]
MDYAVLVSGGVDSAVALHTLRRQGISSIRAYYLKIWLEDDLSFLGNCPWEEDLRYARDVCAAAKVPLEVIPLQQEYYDRVVSYTLEELRNGFTPSPDIFCNQRIKFGAFFDAIGGSTDRIATGHYAGLERVEGAPVRLMLAPDPVKDQTYFLSHLSQEQLSRAEFPLGSMTKEQVRARAAELDLSNKDRPDSQGICFLGRIRYPDFVRHYLGSKDGPIIDDETGAELGRHNGAWFYTIGQRQGLGLGNGPWYVTGRDIDSNVITVTHGTAVAARAKNTFTIGDLTWTSGAPAVRRDGDAPRISDSSFRDTIVGDAIRLKAKIRHGPALTGCTVERLDGTSFADATRLRVTMDEADRGVAPGQFAVLYDPPYCLGAGKILPGAAR